ncbi:MAG: TIM-barrel domain-containing protein, partial [Candidatus Dormibacteraceae bacterium]
MSEPARYMVRRVVGHDGPDLLVEAVAYTPMPGVQGIVTAESVEDQGLQTNLPNLPDLATIAHADLAAARARLRVTEVMPDVARLRMWADGMDMPPDDGGGQGMLVSHPGLGSTRPFPAFEFQERPFAFGFRGLLRGGGDRRQVEGFPLAPNLGLGSGRTVISFHLDPEALVYGFGEQFSRLVQNGHRLELRNADGLGSGTGPAYKNLPIFHVGSATVLVHTPSIVHADIGASDESLLVLEVEEPTLDLFIVGGGDLKHRLALLTELTGRSKVPPVWAFGLWMSRCRYRTRDELEQAARGMREHRVPCDVLHVDPDWLQLDRLNCDFRWSEEKYPDPEEMIRKLAEMGYHLSVWELPYIDRASPVYDEAQAAGYLVRRADGNPARADKTSADGRPRGLVDFSNPSARRWWQEKHRRLIEMGVAVMKTDFGEGLPDDAVMHDGRSGRAWHNLYPLWYNRTVFEAIESLTGRAGLVWGRSGWVGSQRYPAQWAGDPESSLAGMAATLRGGLSYALSAPGFWSHDIGGFYGPPPSP